MRTSSLSHTTSNSQSSCPYVKKTYATQTKLLTAFIRRGTWTEQHRHQERREGGNNRGQEKGISKVVTINQYVHIYYVCTKHCCTSLNTHCWCFGKGEQIKLEKKKQGRQTPCHVKWWTIRKLLTLLTPISPTNNQRNLTSTFCHLKMDDLHSSCTQAQLARGMAITVS